MDDVPLSGNDYERIQTHGSRSFRVMCRSAMHGTQRPYIGLGCGRNELRPYRLASRFTRKDAEPTQI